MKISRRTLVQVACASAVALCTGSAFSQSAFQTFMNVPGLQGDSTDGKYPNWIELTAFSQSVTPAKTCSRVVAQKRIDRASPGLISRAAAGTVIPQVDVVVRRNGDSAQVVYRVTLNTVQIESLELAGPSENLVERLVMRPRSVVLEYIPQMPDGTYSPPIVATISC